MANLPYVQVTGTLEKMLDKIKTASVPERFSQDFVSTKLSMKGGSARSVIPFIKKLGLVGSDGTPTERYKEFRNPAKAGYAIAQGMREIYATLFEMNEYIYEVDNTKLKGLIVEATGAVANSTSVKKTVSTFNALKKRALFDVDHTGPVTEKAEELENAEGQNQIQMYAAQTAQKGQAPEGINLSYTINLNLPPTTDIEVFNAIFKSLKRHLLQE